MGKFFDQDIAHIARVMVPSLIGDLGGPILSAEYWRGRLHELLDGAPNSARWIVCCFNWTTLRPMADRRHREALVRVAWNPDNIERRARTFLDLVPSGFFPAFA
jgi:hypothetical protein